MIFDTLKFLDPTNADTTTITNNGASRLIIGGGPLPSNPDVGELWFDGVLKFYDGTSWQAVGGNLQFDASAIISGTFADARIAASNVTQHQAALTIAESQITDGPLLARNAGNETITGTWAFSNPVIVGTPVTSGHAATKQYVDTVAQGLVAKPRAELATTAPLSATYDNGVGGVGATLTATSNGAFPTIDGVTLTSTTPGSNGVLVKNQSNPAHNGRYNLTQVGNASQPWVLTRCELCDEASEIPGSYVFVKAGTVNAGTGWVLVVSNPATFVVGTDAINVNQFSSSGTYTAGFGLALTGNQFSVSGTASPTPSTVVVRDSAASIGVGNLTATGNIIASGTDLVIGEGVTTSSIISVEIGRNRTTNGVSQVDFWAAASPGNYNARIIRNSGVNGSFDIQQTGIGSIRLYHEQSGDIEFIINNTLIARVRPTGNIEFHSSQGLTWSAFSNFTVAANVGTGNPGIRFDTGDYIDFNRSTNVMQLSIGSSPQISIQGGIVSIPPTTASTSKTTGALVVAGGVGVAGNLYASSIVAEQAGTGRATLNTDSGGSLSLGRTDGVASTPYIDFNSGSTAVDRDARIEVSGGTGVNDGGNLDIRAGFISMVGGVLESVTDLGTVSGAVNLSFKNGNYACMTINGNTTFSFSDFPFGGRVASMVIEITNGGGYVINWPGALNWVPGSAPSLRVTGVNLIGIIVRANGAVMLGTLIA